MPDVLKGFIRDRESVLARERDQRTIVAQVEPLLKRFVTSEDRSWIDDGTNAKRAELKGIGVVHSKQGETSRLVTPSRDIHKVENPAATPSMSVYVYGCDMGTYRRRRYDAVTGAIKWYCTPHVFAEIVIA